VTSGKGRPLEETADWFVQTTEEVRGRQIGITLETAKGALSP